MVFELLSEEIRRIVKKRGFVSPTPPQKVGIPVILSEKNVLLIAQTGTGKTESAMIPIFDMWIRERPKAVSILYITPLRALNRDLLERLRWWANEIGLDISVRHGDTSPYTRKMQSEVPPDMLITTPETLQAILVAKRMREHLKNVKWVVVDEVHELFTSKRGVQLSVGLERLRNLSGDFQVIGLSATVKDEISVSKFISGGRDVEVVKAFSPKDVIIKVVCPETTNEDRKLSEALATTEEIASRVRLIKEIITKRNSVLVFTNTRDFAEILSSRLKILDKNFPIEVHHSSLSKEVRIEHEKKFKKGELKALVCTSSLELGIDIGSIDFIVQYMSPRQTSRLLQRVGRSGHGIERVSEGIIVAGNEDDIFESAVIARKVLRGELEEQRIHSNALDVLAHQIVGTAMDGKDVPVKKSFETINRSYPFKNLTFQQFKKVVDFLQAIKLIRVNEIIRKTRNGLLYYFSNLSTIPDVRRYVVINMLTNQKIGVLDEEFVALHASIGKTFIVKGEPWKIVSIEPGKIFVEPSDDVEAAVPGWEGELIPVPFDVAQEVGKLRREIAEKLKVFEKKDVIEWLKKEYPIDSVCARKMVRLIEEHTRNFPLPDDSTIMLEGVDEKIILHGCFGSKVNETLGRAIAYWLQRKLGSISFRSDPYRIIFDLSDSFIPLVEEALKTINKKRLETYVMMNLHNSNLFLWRFIQVAKRFGVIRKDASYTKSTIRKIIEELVGSPVFEETIREIKVDKLDLKRASEVLEKIQNGKIKLVKVKKLTPLGKLGLEFLKFDIVYDGLKTVSILDFFKKKILESEVRMVCVNCGKWTSVFKVKDVPDRLRCPVCGAKLIGITYPKDYDALKIIQKGKKGVLNQDEKKKYRRLIETADLFIVYGKKAVITLKVKGIGPETARRILARMYIDEDDFFRSLLEAQRQWIKSKKYWS
ncbi:MAG: DEAD/DEAH box helicase [Candidatus Aenigmarchaeota archaeon]|nr:DEAD/DEAH box helicase [Candidatus Aenigmarchaeota archaeon]